MGFKGACQLGGLLLLIIGLSESQEDSLRSALNAVDRRQKDLSALDDYGDFGYSLNGPDDLEFLSNDEYPSEGDRNAAIERVLFNYLESPDEKQHVISSSFRERLEQDKEQQLEDLAESLLAPENDRDDYQDLLREYYSKYKTPVNYRPKSVQKRPYYYAPRFDYNNIQKRKYYDPSDYSNDSDDPVNRLHSRNYRVVKRFPVAKRSSEMNKRSANKEPDAKTDPKVAKELSNIFGTSTTTITPKPTEKPIQIKKKSVQWSDYFGLDRRKKSEDLDKEWLMERYQKAVAVTKKRNAEYPLKNFKNHDDVPDKKEERSDVREIDAKLKAMEDAIIDDALKFTGSREGTADTQEIQEIKDRVISRLAAAYSLEKMRRALGEYKQSVAKVKEFQPKTDYEINEEKRVVVPRKQAVDEERDKIPESDNNIKCSQGDENCDEQNYRTAAEVLEQTTFDACPRVQRACNEAATILGHHAKVFETACNIHQMCLLCDNNSWFSPTRHCNALFLTKAYEQCDGNEECQKEAQKSVRYLLDVNVSLRLEPLAECELACQDKR